MTRHLRLNVRTVLSALALTLALPVLAWMPSRELLTLQPESRMWVDGTSSIKSFSCKAPNVAIVVDAAPNGIAQVIAGEKGVRSVSVTVPSAKLECGNGTMNEHMGKALKIKDNPTIVFKLTSYDVARAAAGASGVLKGTLMLGGVTKPISISAAGTSEVGALHVKGSYELKMSDYDLKAPSLMFGRIKVRDAVIVNFDLLLKS